MKKYSRLLGVILAVCMLMSVLPFGAAAESVSFTDTYGSWAEEYILYWANTPAKDGTGYVIGGYADGSFRPNNNITRGAVAAILNRAYGFTVSGATHSFYDVPMSNTFYKDIMACADNGVINGYGDGSFKPANSITRQAAIAMIARCAMSQSDYAEFSDKTACRNLLNLKFGDSFRISEQFYAEFCYMCTYGKLEGYPDGTVRPEQNITRAQFVKLLYSSINRDDPNPVVPGKSYALNATLTSGDTTLSASATDLRSDDILVKELMDLAVVNSDDINTAFPSPSGSKSLNAYINIYEMCSEDGWNANTKAKWSECISAAGEDAIISACRDPQSTTPISTLNCGQGYKVTITDDVRTYELTVTLVAE